jgi:hypothetical protein
MKRLIALASLAVLFAVSSPIFASSQQDKMKGCNEEAKGMKGNERKAFMSKCLKKDYVLKADKSKKDSKAGPSEAQKKQQDKMKSCNADATAKGLKGDERKKFMSTCLKK